jgi:hypothetical protein
VFQRCENNESKDWQQRNKEDQLKPAMQPGQTDQRFFFTELHQADSLNLFRPVGGSAAYFARRTWCTLRPLKNFSPALHLSAFTLKKPCKLSG